eukprot:TRINITY_DN16126_c0_g2_i1.p1 TRINITY_DN16126_c0_g2~~TRINITY_DN16126_c0_g2_i1.p1  ORF type:complete len:521 (+),score=120.48 TRINITY_DN16126_c0_g2_i1:292-1854(+)
MRYFFEKKLGISERQLEVVQWSSVVEAVEKLQRSFKISNVKDHNALDIANRIMRKDNYLIALLNQEVFPTKIGLSSVKVDYFGKAFEWNLRLALLDPMFSSDFSIQESFISNATNLQRRLKLLGLTNLILMPFILLFLSIFFFLKHFESFYSNRSDLLAGERSRTWTPLARWLMREFNELPHVFGARIDSSETHTLAQQFIKQFPNFVLAMIGRLVSYISGSIVGVLLAVLAFGRASVLTNLHLFEKTFLWHLLFFSSILALSRAVSEAEPSTKDPEEVMVELYSKTHYFPDRWKNRCHNHEVLHEFSSLYELRLVIFLREMVSIVLTPFALLFILPNRSAAILDFIQMHTKSIDGIGDVCDFSRFDLKRLGDVQFGSPPNATSVSDLKSLRESKFDRAANALLPPGFSHAKDGKLEKSVLNFAMEHPSWAVDPACGKLIEEIKSALDENPPQAAVLQKNVSFSRQPISRMSDSADLLTKSFSSLMPSNVVSSQTNLTNSLIKGSMFQSLLALHQNIPHE